MSTTKNMRVVALLTACQAALLTNNIILVGLNGIVGYALLGDDKSLATLPITTYILGTACTTVPASLWMKRFGRQAGFIAGALIGVVGALVGVTAILTSSFWLLCFGTLLIGGYNAFGQYYRFAAAEATAEHFRSRALSLVLAGGVVGAIFGPEISKLTKDALWIPFAGTYFFLLGLAVVAVILQLLVKLPPPAQLEGQLDARPLALIVRQRQFIFAIASSMLGYASMNFIMTAAPIAMVTHHHAYSDAAFVIEWHALAMFAPSFGTGSLIRRFGNLVVIQAGAMLTIGCIIVSTFGEMTVGTFWLALMLLGVGWNFLYVGGSTLLTTTYRPSERAKAQATHDQLVFIATAISSVFSGWLLQRTGWPALAIMIIPLPLIVLLSGFWATLARPIAEAPAE
jgi:predicted MFS family arabinose efflux permease